MDRTASTPYAFAESLFLTVWDTLPVSVTKPLNAFRKFTHCLTAEAYATFRFILPASINWMWRHHVTGEIKSIKISAKIDDLTKSTNLYQHPLFSQIEKGNKVRPLILIPGIYSHPFTELHLADAAQKTGTPTFSLALPEAHKETAYDSNVALIKSAIERIKKFVEEKDGIFDGALIGGHSMGGILSAKLQFIDSPLTDNETPYIRATCAIASRLNSVTDDDCSEVILRSRIRTTYQQIVQKNELPLVQIVAGQDWLVPENAAKVRPGEDCHTVPNAMHLNILYAPDTQTHFHDFLNKFKAPQ